jgi:hypothetical protein
MAATASREIHNFLTIAGAQSRFIPVITTHRIDLCDIKFAIVKGDAMRRVQTAEDRYLTIRVANMFGIRKRQHYAVAGLGHQQHSARTESHLPGMRRVREDCYLKAWR